MSAKYLAIVNPAAGGGRVRGLVGPALTQLRSAGLNIEVAETSAAGEATEIAREAYAGGWRQFIAVGGDGTSYEVVNGLFPEALQGERPSLGFLPLGTGNSFLRDFSDSGSASKGLDHARAALIAGRSQPCDLLRLRHRGGEVYSINLLSVGFTADVNTARSHRFKNYGVLGYWAAIFTCLARLDRRAFPLRVVKGESDESAAMGEFDRRRCLFLTFNNSKFTGGTMKIAPLAETADGLIEYVRWGPIGRIGLVSNLPGLYSGQHIYHPLAERQAVKRIEFDLAGPVDVMVDGEAVSLHCESLEIVPSALEVVV